MTKYAIIGMSGRFPGSNNIDDFFNNLLLGKCSIEKLNDTQISESPFSGNKKFVPVTASFDDADYIDASFFKMSPSEAKVIDPQQRVFLKCCYEALEDAACSPQKSPNRIGVFGSSAISSYLLNNVMKSNKWTDMFNYSNFIGNQNDFAATRVSYKLNLTGPSLTVQSGCSSSMVAISAACSSLKNGHCDIALAGGVSITYPRNSGYIYNEGTPFSSTGKIRPFDDTANGMVKGDGCGVIVIKSLEDALRDKNSIYSIIDGIGVNNDGNRKVGYAAPSINGERSAIREAIKNSKIDSNQIDYIETHGTGTPLGDPIEIRALSQAYNLKSSCQIGSVKANIGHLDSASGIVGLIKGSLILHHNIIPKSVGFKTANSNINFEKANLFINNEVNNPLDPKTTHYVGVSSFGIGGTNVHIILESGKKMHSLDDYQEYLIPLSSKNEVALKEYINRFINFLKRHEQISLKDVSKTLIYGRSDYEIKKVFIAESVNTLLEKLENDNFVSSEVFGSSTYQEWFADKYYDLTSVKRSGAFIFLPKQPFNEDKYLLQPLKSDHNKENSLTNYDDKEADIKQMITLWNEVLGTKNVHDNSDFFNLDGDSLIAIDLLERVNKVYSSNVETSELINNPTPSKLLHFIIGKHKNNQFDNVQEINYSGSQAKNLFLIHPAGGSTYCFHALIKNMQHVGLNVYAISYPESLKTNLSISKLASLYIKQISKIQVKGPYIIGGYSFGGNVAVEIARQLEKEKQKVPKVYLIDSLVPEAYSSKTISIKNYQSLFPLAWTLMSGNNEAAKKLLKMNFSNHSFNEIISLLKRKNLMSDSLEDNKIRKLFDIWVDNHSALGQQPTSAIKADIILFSSTIGMPIKIYKLTKMSRTKGDAWQRYTQGNLKILPCPGNHFTMMSDGKNLKALANQFQQEMNVLAGNSYDL